MPLRLRACVHTAGGQKARVALARAAYSGCRVQLLDDPLSAVDPRVGRVLFDKCIGPKGILAGAATGDGANGWTDQGVSGNVGHFSVGAIHRGHSLVQHSLHPAVLCMTV